MIILDSNVWIALLHESDSQHKKAEDIFGALDDSITITEYVVLEVCTILAQKAGKSITNTFIQTITQNADIHILPADGSFFLDVLHAFYDQKSKNLSFVDVSLLVLSKSHKIISFDAHLKKALQK